MPCRLSLLSSQQEVIRGFFSSFRHDNLEVVKGDACDLESFASAVEGKDAVMSCLGTHVSIFNPTTLYSESIKAITEAMKRSVYSQSYDFHLSTENMTSTSHSPN